MLAKWECAIENPQEHFCYVCYTRKITIVASDMIIVLGNLESQDIASYAYCRKHAEGVIDAFDRRALFFEFQQTRRHADQAIVKWKDSSVPHFL